MRGRDKEAGRANRASEPGFILSSKDNTCFQSRQLYIPSSKLDRPCTTNSHGSRSLLRSHTLENGFCFKFFHVPPEGMTIGRAQLSSSSPSLKRAELPNDGSHTFCRSLMVFRFSVLRMSQELNLFLLRICFN